MRDTPKSTGKKDKPMTSVLLPEGELRVARCDMLDKLIAVGDGRAEFFGSCFVESLLLTQFFFFFV